MYVIKLILLTTRLFNFLFTENAKPEFHDRPYKTPLGEIEIAQEKVAKDIHKLKVNKSAGPDNIHQHKNIHKRYMRHIKKVLIIF